MAARDMQVPVLLSLILLAFYIQSSNEEVLTPPYFNLAQEREITATATCGEEVAVPEWFCRLTAGSTNTGSFQDTELIRGQYCDYCDPKIPKKDHPARYAIDGTERWWQSPPLSRGMFYNEVNLTINLAQEFHVAYVFIKAANSPRPGLWALERSVDFGETWKPWQYFAETPSDCNKFFGMDADTVPATDDSVICSTKFSTIVPLEGGEIAVSLVNNRPNKLNFSYSEALQDWTKATNVRLRLLRTKTLLGHLMAVARQDPTVTRRYFYSIKDISIGGRCVCNGHADTCDRADPTNPNQLVCNCQRNTCGNQCAICCPGFIQKKWQPGHPDKPFNCEPCQCYGHASECLYEEEVDMKRQSIDIYGDYVGGGVCQNCQHNTMGINCDQCVPGYYNPYNVPLDSLDACIPCECDDKKYTGECLPGSGRCKCSKEYEGENCDRCSFGYYGYPDCIPCDCNLNGTEGQICTVNGGQCPCKVNYVGKSCDMCAFGYYNFPECTPCTCNTSGSLSNICNEDTGQCPCEINFSGQNCDMCQNGFHNFPTCTNCDCEQRGTEDEVCSKDTGRCICKDNYLAPRCDRCAPEYHSFPACDECQCAEPGSMSTLCRDDGQCLCKPNYGGLTCGHCAPGYYKYPECLPCRCDLYGSYGQSCDQVTGQCTCGLTFEGLQCNKCKPGFYNYPNCEECNCNPAGAKEVAGYPLGGCGVVIKGLLCECKDKVMGRICDQCMPGYFNLDRNNPEGCTDCDCYGPGTESGLNLCNAETGQCVCKLDAGGRRCDTCRDGFYGLSESNPFGCVECNCDMGGSVSGICDKKTGQCRCKPRVTGRRCESPNQMHFYPTLQQLIYEVEDGRTPEGSRIRYGFDSTIFPNYSWRGYAILTHLQPEVVMDIEINRPSLYRVIYRYENLNTVPIKGEVTLKPESVADVAQRSDVIFEPAEKPKFTTVGSAEGIYEFVLNPGRWTISINAPEILLLDYMVLVPQAYYEATVLQTAVTRPCTIPNDDGPCLLYNYPDLSKFPTLLGGDGYIVDDNNNTIDTQVVTDPVILNELGLPSLAKLDKNQTNLNLFLEVPTAGKYVFILNYYALSNTTQELDVILRTPEGDTKGTVVLYNCQYSVLCRQVIKGMDNMPLNPIINRTVEIILMGNEMTDVAIGSVVAIPYPEWTLGFVRPSIICIRINGICIGSKYSSPSGSVRIEFEDPPNQDRRVSTDNMPLGLLDTDVGLVLLNSTDQVIQLEGNVQIPSQYVFVAHFYLPLEVGLSMPVRVHTDGQVINGVFRPTYCPSTSGCRGLIYFDTEAGNNILSLTEGKVRITFNNTSGKNIWMDYLLLVPATQFSPADLNIQPVDNSINFLKTCIGPGFELINDSEFCRKGVYSLTTDFNNGAVPCHCNIDGSMSFGCDNFGGQCECRENVIGRSCSQCREGFYGFPNCRACNCPYGTCHPITGDCICPARVKGDRCDECVDATYGYDPLVGCTNCDCQIEAVRNNDMNCEQMTGQCSCKDNVGGRRCDHCITGFYSYPYCDLCQCDLLGTEESICDAATGVCNCKENVAAPYCDSCEPGSFYLNSENPKGCTSCFCFGTTTSCASTNMLWQLFKDMDSWGATNVPDDKMHSSRDTLAVLNADAVTDEVIYWQAPDSYLGNKVIAYGGRLMYSLVYILPRDDPTLAEKANGPGVMLTGRNMTVVHYYNPDLEPSRIHQLDVELYEFNFVHSDSGSKVSRDQFMMILVGLESLQIRASYYSNIEEVRLMNVTMEIATEDGINGFADSVEQCQCPTGYTGTSCEQCAQGYYRARSTPFLGICVPCECYGHSDTCDSVTGECLACMDNTFGKHCEACLPGHYGDATTGACSICSCPLPIPSNNFATSCSVSEGRLLSCECNTGYGGLYCDRCSPGYYGDPREVNSTCNPCSCSGNIDMNNPESCNIGTGECEICLNNSTGPSCSLCVDWWYGDAVNEKNCQPCQCNRCGSDVCDNGDGLCTCKPNVVGIDCDQCAPDTYGFDSCSGCRDCGCSEASISTQCDLNDGQCPCQTGTTGRTCDSCMEGYWNFSPSGCQECQCTEDGAVSCDPATGECRCLPGVTGPTCDRCLPRWVLVPNKGCKSCDNCVHILLDDIEYLDRNMSGMAVALEGVSVGVSAMRRLSSINDSVEMLKPKIDDIREDTEQANNVMILVLKTQTLKTQMNTLGGKSDDLAETAKNVDEDTASLLTSGDDIEKQVTDVSTESAGAVRFVDEVLATIEKSSQVTNIDTYILQSNEIMDEIQQANFSGKEDMCNMESSGAEKLVMEINDMKMNSTQLMEETTALEKKLENIQEALFDLRKKNGDSNTDAGDALDIVDRLRNIKLKIINVRLNSAEMDAADIKMLIDMSNELLAMGAMAIEKTSNDTKDVEVASTQLDDAINQLRANNEMLSKGLNDTDDILNKTRAHANDLVDSARMLDSVYTNTRGAAKNALDAAQAYKDIVMAINDAYNASTAAVNAADDALGKSNGVGETSANSKNVSSMLLAGAQERVDKVQTDLQDRLKNGKMATDEVEKENADVKERLKNIDDLLGLIDIDSNTKVAQDSATKADNAKKTADNSQLKVNDILDKLPGDKMKVEELIQDTTHAKKDITDVTQQTKFVMDSIPTITDLMDQIGSQSESVKTLTSSVMGNITQLRDKINLARDQANRIRVALQFLGNTTVALRNPPNIDQVGSYTRLSMHIKTQQTNALLAYVGAKYVKDRPSPDFMALELKNGQVVFRFDLGSGPAVIVHPWNVSDDQWYRVSATRIGKTGTLTLTRDDDPEVVVQKISGDSSGTFTVLELNPQTTRFYMGGVPQSVELPDDLSYTFYEGVMEDVLFDDQPLGLWNFVDGENNYVGAIERNVLKTVKSNGFSFNGKGYAILSARKINFRPATKATLILRFKTYAANGLLLFMGKGRDFTSLELRDGRIYFQYDLGGTPAQFMSNKTYNDGEWHKIQAARIKQNGGLIIDNSVESIQGRSPGSLTGLAYDDEIYIGGYPELVMPVNGVQSIGFDGCIEDVQFDSTQWDLIKNERAINVIPGCPDKILRTATFQQGGAGFVAVPADSIGVNFDVTFRMKTESDRSLLLFTSDSANDNVFSVSTVDGKVIVTSVANGDLTRLESTVNTYNDGNWHYISIMKMGRKLTMNIDDQEMVSESTDQDNVATSRPIYFGGTDFTVPEELVGTSSPFSGCISDITINRRFINLVSIEKNSVRGAKFADCSMAGEDTDTPTALPPVISTLRPGMTTDKPPELCALPKDADLSGTGGDVTGMMFGMNVDSHQLYTRLPGSLRIKFEFTVELRTTAEHGIIFYTSDKIHTDFASLYMKDGNLVFAFSCGSGTATITSSDTYNDGQWHTVKFARNQRSGVMAIDGTVVGNAIASGGARSLNVVLMYYIGGIPADKVDKAKKNTQRLTTGFVGCIKSFQLGSTELGQPAEEHGIMPCRSTIEHSTFFYGAGGYVQLEDSFRVGLDLKITIDIRPRNLTGVLLSVHKPGGDYLVLQMKDGKVIFTTDNGAGAISTELMPAVQNALCDGGWHSISAQKAKNVVLLSVDGEAAPPGQGKAGVSSADTNHPLYVGGVPDTNVKAVVADSNYLGCIRNLVIKGEQKFLTSGAVTGDVKTDFCPVN